MERNRLRPVYTCDFCCSNLMQISSPSGAISSGFYRDLTAQGFRTCYKLNEILLQFFNDESQGTPRDVSSRGIMEENKRTKNCSWSYNEEAAFIELWQNFASLFNTS